MDARRGEIGWRLTEQRRQLVGLGDRRLTDEVLAHKGGWKLADAPLLLGAGASG